ncbi:MAG: hypothetical protein MJ156_02830 [Alphaproteobacteria bacterium]|nr:hypothetical protein [Alphaproteobacteria bacterium]
MEIVDVRPPIRVSYVCSLIVCFKYVVDVVYEDGKVEQKVFKDGTYMDKLKAAQKFHNQTRRVILKNNAHIK